MNQYVKLERLLKNGRAAIERVRGLNKIGPIRKSVQNFANKYPAILEREAKLHSFSRKSKKE